MRFQRAEYRQAVPVPAPADRSKVYEQLWEEVDRRFGCPCTETELCYRIYCNGVKQFYRQCRRCGEWKGPLKKAALPFHQRFHAPPADAARRDAWREKRYAFREQLVAAERARQTSAFWNRYDEYLRSEAWRVLSAAVLKRDRYVCQYCGGRATQAHHLTYEHVFHELLFELVAVCFRCHEERHG